MYSHPIMIAVSFSHLELVMNVLFWMRYDHRGWYCFKWYNVFWDQIVKIPESVFFSRVIMAYSDADPSSGMCIGSFSLFFDLLNGIRVIVGLVCFMIDSIGCSS